MKTTQCILDKLSSDDFSLELKTKPKPGETGVYIWFLIHYKQYSYQSFLNLGNSFWFKTLNEGTLLAKNDNSPFLETDEYFNLNILNPIPDFLLKDNYCKIYYQIKDRLKSIYRHSYRYEIFMRINGE
ncbi:hypothetical protein XaC1_453 [Xanthomonas phage XaC1]|nr:hypothetical protein XaC1_453 [Xanthomonas phage XaC1]